MDKNPHIDQRYIQGLLQNDPQVIGEIYSQYAEKIKWLVLHNNGNEDDAADIFQEALTDIFRRASKGDFVLTCPFEAFLVVICKNKWISQLEKKQRQGVTFKDPTGYDVGADVFKDAETVQRHSERRSLLEAKLAALGESCRDILRLSWAGRAMNEVADTLKVSYGYVRKKKSECMGRLTELIRQAPEFKHLQYE